MIYKKKLRALKLSFNFFQKNKKTLPKTLYLCITICYTIYVVRKRYIKERGTYYENNLQRKRIKKNNN